MNEKYYTPTIEEFHVGFEFEINTAKEENDGRYWLPAKINADVLLKGTSLIDLSSNTRVKYLDQSDIESLGWTYDINMSERDCDSFYIESGLDDKKRFIQYSIKNYRNGIIDLDKCIDCGVHEIGLMTVKNKSELKKLMKQLNIL